MTNKYAISYRLEILKVIAGKIPGDNTLYNNVSITYDCRPNKFVWKDPSIWPGHKLF